MQHQAGWDCHVHVFDATTPARPGHYQPPPCTLAALLPLAAGIGVRRLVLVQPSLYGADNRLLLSALQHANGQHRGVVVVDDSITEPALQAMHALGVRGVRINRVSPVGNSPTLLVRLAPWLRTLGWCVQWYARPDQLAGIADFHQQHRLVGVLDHLAGITADIADHHPVWADLRRFADAGGWVKLSGWYRLGAQAPYATLQPALGRVAALFGEFCVWGSDWPHTWFMEPGCTQPAPRYADTWQPVQEVLGAVRADAVLRTQPLRLYR